MEVTSQLHALAFSLPGEKLPVLDLETSTMRRSRPELRLLRRGKEESTNHEAPHNVIFSNLLLLFFQRRLSSSALNDALLQFLQSTQYNFHGGGIPPTDKLIKKFPIFMDDLLLCLQKSSAAPS
jgi:hypothetical protein